MRTEPTWRIPIGVLALFAALLVYGIVIARYVPGIIGTWPTLAYVPAETNYDGITVGS